MFSRGFLGGLTGGIFGGIAAPARGARGISLGLTLNGVTATPLAAYRGKDATSTTWSAKVGQTLVIQGASSAPTLGVSSGKSNPDDAIAVQFTSGNTYTASGNAYLDDDGVGDYAYECVFNFGASTVGEKTIFSKYQSAGGHNVLLYKSNTNLTTVGPLGTVVVSAPAASSWHHFIGICKRGATTRQYLDGAFVQSVTNTTNGFATVASPFQIGAYNGATNTSPGDEAVAWLAIWSGVNLCAGTTGEQDAVALARSKAAGF